MKAPGPRNLAASVLDRLRNRARASGDELQLLLMRYALERLLYRLSCSPHRDRFVLKGAMLFQVWTEQPHRPTRDLDLLGYGEPSPERLADLFRELCGMAVDADGLVFNASSVRSEPMKADEEYQGVRLRLEARLGNARIPVLVDVGFGDAITPAPETITYPVLLDLPAPRLLAYPRETVVAEKLEAMVSLGIANSRMKDFYDLWVLSRSFAFEGERLAAALAATFTRRQTAIPSDAPLALSPAFAAAPAKQAQWSAFLRRGRLMDDTASLDLVVEALGTFLLPPLHAAAGGRRFTELWPEGGPWMSARANDQQLDTERK